MSKLKRNIVCVALFLLATVLSLFGLLGLDKTVSASAAGTPVQTESGAKTYALFNSGLSGIGRNQTGSLYSDALNPSPYTYTNGGYDIYVRANTNTYNCSSKAQLGLPFKVTGEVSELALLTINAYDVDEESGEMDGIYLVNATDGTSVRLGALSGMNEKWNTTTFRISPDYFENGDTYYFQIQGENSSWCVYVRTVSLQLTIDGGVGPTPSQPTITDMEATASITNTGRVDVSLYMKTSKSVTYSIEYAAKKGGYQYGGAEGSIAATTAGVTKNASFQLQSGSPKGTYQIDIIVKDSNNNAVKTMTVNAGYQYYSVSYNANGGSNNLPLDSTAYASGGYVTVLFDYVPSRSGYVFAGWSTNRSATEPMYTANGTKNFNIYSDVTLYAVWHSAQHVHTEGAWIVGQEATCAQSGYKYTVCTGCGEEMNRVTLPKLPHTDGEWVVQSNATCTTNGVKALKCANCAEYIRYSYVPALGHDYVSEVISEATCTQDGCIQYTCNTCNHSYQVTVNAEHNYVLTVQEATCTEDGAMIYTCSICGDIYTTAIPASHSYVAEVIRLATRDEDGLIRYTCEVCGHYYEEIVPASDANVLLIQDRVPWSVDNVPKLLNKLVTDGYIAGWSATTTSQFNQVNLAQYSVVYIANDQTTATYNQMSQLTEALTAFANAGGVVVYGACDNGWAGGEIRYTLPGGVEKIENISRYNYILDNAHPIVTGSLTDDKALTNALLNGTYCSHTSFRESTLPTGYNVILQDGYGNPTLAEYPMGDGKIIVSGLTWEFYYSRIYQGSTSYSKNVFDDLIVYAASLADYVPCEHMYDDGVTVNATCTTEGYTLHTCTLCQGEMKDNFVPALGHDMGVWTVEREATCEVSGLKSQTCNRCQERVEEVIPAGVHTWVLVEEIVDDCLTDFIAVYECENCQAELRLVKPAKGAHVYDDGTVIAPTCIEGGYTLYTCTVCEYTMQADFVDATGVHVYELSSWQVATCAQAGYRNYACIHCEVGYTESIDMLEHTVYSWIVDFNATCGADGQRSGYCEVCRGAVTEAIPQLEHIYELVGQTGTCGMNNFAKIYVCRLCNAENRVPFAGSDTHNYRESERVEATCTANGTITYTCRNCGSTYSIIDENAPALGHSHQLTATVNATCTSNGYKRYTCHCGDSYDVVIRAYDHNYVITEDVSATCTEDGYTRYTCTRCYDFYNNVIPQYGHNMDDGVCVQPSTCLEDAIYWYGCENGCGYGYEVQVSEDHSVYHVAVEAVAATCTEDGLTAGVYCNQCDAWYVAQETIPAIGHNVETVNGFPATCDNTGLTDGEYCGQCETWLTERVEIPGGHIEGEWTPVYENGKLIKEEKTCQRCGMELDVRIPFVDDEGEEDSNKPNQPDVDIYDNEVNVGSLNIGCSGVIGMAGILPCVAIGGALLLRRRKNDSLEE